MRDDKSSCTVMDVVGQRTDRDKPAIRDLRLQNLELRNRLKTCEIDAARSLVMLREGDHRIKNSLQLVASLIRLQAMRETSNPVRAALNAAATRISSVAGIHDALQATHGVDLIDLGAVVRKMCDSLQAMVGDDGHTQVIVEADALNVPVALAQPIVLAVNELVVNALRHAFPDRDSGLVRVSLSRTDGGMMICVKDDGIGLPPDHAAGHGYGMALVRMMVKQIGGKLQTEGNAGACFTIHAPLRAP